ncbi:unnamed protein product [Pleuronectes platessa]|uniref:Uncharacterized protein n=1 Tax=Pleuronectes platessa TaxID=8262 RepID=A0A9N7VG93_PLEPL|nr:unnamed protein product [Pleuronectes platessa]
MSVTEMFLFITFASLSASVVLAAMCQRLSSTVKSDHASLLKAGLAEVVLGIAIMSIQVQQAVPKFFFNENTASLVEVFGGESRRRAPAGDTMEVYGGHTGRQTVQRVLGADKSSPHKPD